MDDEIKVTVIATGFDSHIQSMLPLPRNMDAMAAGANSAQVYGQADGAKEENLDVPTFIRRQAD